MSASYAVIGNPIAFSKSPAIHGEFARQLGQDLVYTRILGPLGQFAATVDGFRAGGGRGLNVTAPFLRLASNAGVGRLADGVGMLAEQAAEAFAWWRGVRPPTAQVIEQLRVPLQ